MGEVPLQDHVAKIRLIARSETKAEAHVSEGSRTRRVGTYKTGSFAMQTPGLAKNKQLVLSYRSSKHAYEAWSLHPEGWNIHPQAWNLRADCQARSTQ